MEALINKYDESVFVKKRNVVNKITGHQQFEILSCSKHRKKDKNAILRKTRCALQNVGPKRHELYLFFDPLQEYD